MKRFQRTNRALPSLCLLGVLLCGMAGAANTNGNGASLNLSATELPSGTAQSNDAGGRLASAETPSAGVVSANAAGAKVIIEPMNAIAGNSETVADFSANVRLGTPSLDVQFTDQSSSGLYAIDAWSWDFGDGSSAGTLQNPQHTYTAAGTFDVTLTVSTSRGSVSKIKTGYITVSQGVPATEWAGSILLACAVGMLGIRRIAPARTRIRLGVY